MTGQPEPDATKDANDAEQLLEAFNAGEIIEHPGEPPESVESPADDSDVQAPG